MISNGTVKMSQNLIVYLRNNLPKLKDGAYIINIDELESIATHWIDLYVNGNNGSIFHDATYFDRFGVGHILKEIKKFIRNKNIITNIHRTQAYGSIMCGYVCTGYIDFMLKGKSLLDDTNLFSSNKYEKSHKLILNIVFEK